MRFFGKFFLLILFSFFAVPGEEAWAVEKEVKVDAEKPWRLKKDEKPKKKKKSVSANKKYKLMARELLGKPHWSERFWGLIDAETPKIAIHPFDAEEIPFSLDEAQVYVDGFTRALVREAGDRYAIVGRKELGAVVSDINEMGTRSDSVNPLGDLVKRARSDLLAVGTLSLKNQKVILSYKLVETESGRIVSASQKGFRRQNTEQVQTSGGLSVHGAAKKASSSLLRDLAFVEKIMVQGVRYQTSGIHTPFGRYFMGLLSDQLRREAVTGPRNINDLDIADFVVEEEAFRGLQLVKGTVERGALKAKRETFILKGTYWVFEQVVEIRLRLESENGKSLSWRGRVLKSEIPAQFKLIPPPPPIDAEHQADLGPTNLYLSSNKGKNPLYQVGEKMTLVVRTGRDAYLSCYYLQADGAIFRIFPNKFNISGKINGGSLLHLPTKGMPYAFEFSPPVGVEAVKCFALDRDLSDQVAQKTKKAAFDPLLLRSEKELTKIYRSLSDVSISEASLIITVQ